MKKKILKILALVLALALIAGICVFANSLVGNPVSKMLVTKTAEKYLESICTAPRQMLFCRHNIQSSMCTMLNFRLTDFILKF